MDDLECARAGPAKLPRRVAQRGSAPEGPHAQALRRYRGDSDLRQKIHTVCKIMTVRR
ncbi:hypothetical protein [Pseudomonas sp. NW5]|uniref:hypothetical protein n=1 Tax=Pseudomonas sp. NW5 TaxID=2934934 RepID=UPI0020224DF2|nr:hypothetical protein [Pseudomonas sp. NW5]MCL7461902.1 hypothetical protein [Pseudomonas sp. NW5]